MINKKDKEYNSKESGDTSVRLFFISDGYGLKTIKYAIEGFQKNNEKFCVISLNTGVGDALLKDGIQSKNLSYYCGEKLWEEVGKKSSEWMLDWPDKKIINGKSIKEELLYKNFSWWWLGGNSLFHDKGGIIDIFFYIEIFFSILRQESPGKIYFIGKKNLGLNALKSISNFLELDACYLGKEEAISDSVLLKIATLKNLIIKFAKTVKRIFTIILRKIAFLIFGFKNLFVKKNPKNLKKILTLPNHANYAREYMVDSKKYIGDFYYRGIEEVLRRDGHLNFISISPEIPIYKKFSWLLDFVEIIKGDSYKPIEAYIRLNTYLKRFYSILYFKRKWKRISSEPSFRESLICEGIDIYPFLESHLKRMFLKYFPSSVGLLDVAYNIIRKEKPDAILTIYETSPDRRCLEIAAKEHNIPVFGLEHGIISSYKAHNIECFHKAGETWYSEKDDILQCPIPNKTLVFGEYFKKLLVEYGYPENSVVATGSPRFDYFSDYSEQTDIKECNKLGIARTDKTILFISTGLSEDFMLQEMQKKEEVNLGAVRDILSVSPQDAQLIIKVHPRDNEKNYDCLFKEFPDRSIKIFKYEDLAILIRVASVVAARSSTAGIEAALQRKPVIVLSLFSEPKLASYYVSEGIALEVDTKDSLKKAIEELLNDTEARRKLFSNIDGSINKFAYAADGKSSLRVKNEIIREIGIK